MLVYSFFVVCCQQDVAFLTVDGAEVLAVVGVGVVVPVFAIVELPLLARVEVAEVVLETIVAGAGLGAVADGAVQFVGATKVALLIVEVCLLADDDVVTVFAAVLQFAVLLFVLLAVLQFVLVVLVAHL